MTVVDYGCGLGSYTTEMAELVGIKGTVYAIDMNRLAIEAVERKMAKCKLRNVRPILEPMWMSGYDSTLPSCVVHSDHHVKVFPSGRSKKRDYPVIDLFAFSDESYSIS